MYRFYENIDIFKKRFHIYFSPIKNYTTVLKLFFKGGRHNVAKGVCTKKCSPSPTQMLSYAPNYSVHVF